MPGTYLGLKDLTTGATSHLALRTCLDSEGSFKTRSISK